MNTSLLLHSIQESIIHNYFQLLHILLIDFASFVPEIISAYYESIVNLFNFSNIKESLQMDFLQLLLAILNCEETNISVSLINQTILLITKSLSEHSTNQQMENQELRFLQYYVLLRLFQ